MKIYEFEFDCDKETAIEEVLRHTKKPILLFEQDVIYARRIGSLVTMHRGISYRNSFRPLFKMHFKELEPGKTVAKGVFVWHWFAMLFSIVWVLIVCSMFFELGDGPKWIMVVPVVFLLFFAGMITYGTYLERNNRKEIIEHIKERQKNINNI